MFANLKIGQKLLIGFGLVLTLGVLLGGMSAWRMARIAPLADVLARHNMVAVKLSGSAMNDVQTARMYLRAYGLSGDEKSLEAGRKHFAGLDATLNQLEEKGKAGDAALLQSVRKVREQAGIYQLLIDKTEKLNGDLANGRKAMDEQAAAFVGALDQLDARLRQEFARTKTDALASLLENTQAVLKLGYDCRVINFKAQALRKTELIETAFPKFDEIKRQAAAMRASAPDENTRQLVDQLEKAAAAYRDCMLNLQATTKQLDGIGAERITASDNVITEVSTVMTKNTDEATQTATTTAHDLNQARSVMTWGLAFMLALGVAAAWLITRAITGPLNACLPVFDAVAQGDLTRRIDVLGRDEVGQVAGKFNHVIEQLAGIINQLSGTSREVASAASQIAASSEQMAAGMREQSAQTAQISSAVDEMASTTVEVARKASDAAGSARASESQAAEGGLVVTNAIREIDAVASMVRETAASITELGARGEQIGTIIGVINDIADQTNLLALNAAIEAARAGEHGRGFAVVADEVRKLAERTTLATKEVASSITAIQSETAQAVQRMHAGTGQVSRAVEQAQGAGAALEQIISNVQNVTGMIQSIAAASEEQSAAGEQISRNLESITAVTAQSADGANQSAGAATHLSLKSEQLQEIVSKFTV
jgi:methyl-accepting chemotaxis protein